MRPTPAHIDVDAACAGYSAALMDVLDEIRRRAPAEAAYLALLGRSEALFHAFLRWHGGALNAGEEVEAIETALGGLLANMAMHHAELCNDSHEEKVRAFNSVIGAMAGTVENAVAEASGDAVGDDYVAARFRRGVGIRGGRA